MPEFRQPIKLETICLNNICDNITSYWFKDDTDAKKVIDSSRLPLYVLGSPFEYLKDDEILYILKRLYDQNELKCSYFVMFFHYRTKKLDLSFITHKKMSLITSYLSRFIGNMCINVTDLNLKSQTDLKPTDLCTILKSMKRLKILNLSHTKANIDVARLISENNLKLDQLDLQGCTQMFEYCIELITDSVKDTIQYIDIFFVKISQELTEKILLNCKRLLYFHVNNLADAIHCLHKNSIENLKLNKLNIDSDTILKEELLNSIEKMCPNTFSLNLNCTSYRSVLKSIGNFKYLNELLLANQDCMISFQFDEHLLEGLRNSIGKQLKLLHLVHIKDVNLKSIAKYCSNLVCLNVEFLDYYTPAKDNYGEYDENNNKIYRDYTINSLRSLTIINNSIKEGIFHSNIGQLKQDLTLLLNNARVTSLELKGLNELDDEYFQSVFSTKDKRGYFLHQHIVNLTLNQMKNISGCLILNFFLSSINSLKYLNLIDCKKISKAEWFKFNKIVKMNQFDCEIKWT